MHQTSKNFRASRSGARSRFAKIAVCCWPYQLKTVGSYMREGKQVFANLCGPHCVVTLEGKSLFHPFVLRPALSRILFAKFVQFQGGNDVYPSEFLQKQMNEWFPVFLTSCSPGETFFIFSSPCASWLIGLPMVSDGNSCSALKPHAMTQQKSPGHWNQYQIRM